MGSLFSRENSFLAFLFYELRANEMRKEKKHKSVEVHVGLES